MSYALQTTSPHPEHTLSQSMINEDVYIIQYFLTQKDNENDTRTWYVNLRATHTLCIIKLYVQSNLDDYTKRSTRNELLSYNGALINSSFIVLADSISVRSLELLCPTGDLRVAKPDRGSLACQRVVIRKILSKYEYDDHCVQDLELMIQYKQ